MAQTSTFDPANINRESIEGAWRFVENEKYPLASALRRTRAKANFEEQPIDRLGTVDTTPAVEGEDLSSFTNQMADRTRIGNNLTKLEEDWAVTDVQEGIARAGGVPGNVRSDKAEALSKAIRILKRKVETTITGGQDTQAASEGVFGISRGLGDWIDSAGPADVPANFRTPAASIQTGSGSMPTKEQFLDVLESIAIENGGLDGFIVFAPVNLRTAITAYGYERSSGLTDDNTLASYNTVAQASAKKITWAVNVIETDYGPVSVMTHYWINEATSVGAITRNHNLGFIIQPGMMELRTLWDIKAEELPDQGGGPRGFVNTVFTLMPGNPRGYGKLDD